MELNSIQPLEQKGSFLKKLKNFKLDEFIYKNRLPLALLLVGAILLGFGVFLTKDTYDLSSTKVEVLEGGTGSDSITSEIVVEVAGAVESPGVYKFGAGARIEDLLIASGGLSVDADRSWIEKFLNRASKLSDGQKVYIPRVDEFSGDAKNQPFLGTSDNSGGGYQNGSSVRGSGQNKLININTASQKELESLWGIGPVYAQNIIEHRPYSTVEELLTRKIIKTNVYERNKNRLTVY